MNCDAISFVVVIHLGVFLIFSRTWSECDVLLSVVISFFSCDKGCAFNINFWVLYSFSVKLIERGENDERTKRNRFDCRRNSVSCHQIRSSHFYHFLNGKNAKCLQKTKPIFIFTKTIQLDKVRIFQIWKLSLLLSSSFSTFFFKNSFTLRTFQK